MQGVLEMWDTICLLPLSLLLVALLSSAQHHPSTPAQYRQLPSLRDQAAILDSWRGERLASIPSLLTKYRIDAWLITQREYAEDTLWWSVKGATEYAPHRRNVLLFHTNTSSLAGQPNPLRWVDNTGDVWPELLAIFEEYKPHRIALNTDKYIAFGGGLHVGEYETLAEELGEEWMELTVNEPMLGIEYIATRVPGQLDFYRALQEITWALIEEAFSKRVITPGVTSTEDVEWWYREKMLLLNVTTWNHPRLSVITPESFPGWSGTKNVIQEGDLLHVDFGITAMGLNTDVQHMAYVLRTSEGEIDAPMGLKEGLRKANRMQDVVLANMKADKTGNKVLTECLMQMRVDDIQGQIYSHPIGDWGHAPGAVMGFTNLPEFVPILGELPILANTYYSIELYAYSFVPERNETLRFRVEENVYWKKDTQDWQYVRGRQERFHLVNATKADLETKPMYSSNSKYARVPDNCIERAEPSFAVPKNINKGPEHLNRFGLCIRYTEGKGRGVYATHGIPACTVVEISPVLLFSATEYEVHGKHTALDHYTFVWRDGRMALALGLGSLFNHSQTPNVSYTIDGATDSIRYMTCRRVMPDEELCIFYGHKLWFNPVDAADECSVRHVEESEDGWGGLSSLGDRDDETTHLLFDDFPDEDSNHIVSDDELPFRRLRLTPDEEEEEDMDAVRRETAWAVDLPDPRLAASMLKWLKQSGFDTPSMTHLKRIRKVNDKMSMVLIVTREHPQAPTFPESIAMPPPYMVTVPKTVALTLTSLKLKSSLWPTIYAPRKKFEPEPWTAGKVRWACEVMKQVVKEAQAAHEKGELPIVAYVPVPYEEEVRDATRMFEAISAHDTRKSALHPLRHSIINLVRAIGELRASSTSTLASRSPPPQPTPLNDVAAPSPDQLSTALAQQYLQNPPSEAQSDTRNGAHYLLTSLTLFATHEPCIMCSMALLHSRVKEVFYLIPMPKTGGCGSVTCIPRLEGVNHRYAVNAWKTGGDETAKRWVEQSGLAVDEACDT